MTFHYSFQCFYFKKHVSYLEKSVSALATHEHGRVAAMSYLFSFSDIFTTSVCTCVLCVQEQLNCCPINLAIDQHRSSVLLLLKA